MSSQPGPFPNHSYSLHEPDIIRGHVTSPDARGRRHNDGDVENWTLAKEDEYGEYATLKPPTDKNNDKYENISPTASTTAPAPGFGHGESDDAYRQLRKRSSMLVNQDKDVFVRTEAYRRAEDLLKGHRIVIIRGTPASGKTALGLALLRYFAVSGFAPLVLRSRKEWSEHIRRNRKQGVLLDNVLGEVRVEREKYEDWLPLLMDVKSAMRNFPNCLLVIVLHSHMMADFNRMTKHLNYLHDFPLVDQDVLPLLPAGDKELMLTRHLASVKVTLEDKAGGDMAERDRCGALFPLCCARFLRGLSKEQYANLKRDQRKVFAAPGLVYMQFFTRVLEDPECRTDLLPLLLLAASKGGFVLGQDDEALEMKLRQLGQVTIDLDLEGVRAWAQLLKGSLLSEDTRQFRTRDLANGFSFALFRNNRGELFLNASDLEFLVKYVHVDVGEAPTTVQSLAAALAQVPVPASADRKRDVVIVRASPLYTLLQRRLCQEILSDNVVQVSQHPALQNSVFLKDFETFIKNNKSLRAVLAAKDHRHGMPLLYWSAWNRSGTLTSWCLEKLLDADGGQVVRKAFLACALAGEKVDSPRMARLFEWLCAPENKVVLNEPVADIAVPFPAEEDRLSPEVKSTWRRILVEVGREGAVLTCGLSEHPAPSSPPPTPSHPHHHQQAQVVGESIFFSGLLTQGVDLTAHHPGSPSQPPMPIPTSSGVSPSQLFPPPPPPLVLEDTPDPGDDDSRHRPPSPPPPPPLPLPPPPQQQQSPFFAFSNHSAAGTLLSDSISTSSGSGSYVSFRNFPALNVNQTGGGGVGGGGPGARQDHLSVIAEEASTADDSSERGGGGGRGGNRPSSSSSLSSLSGARLERSARGGSVNLVVRDRGGTLTSTTQLQGGTPLPPTIVTITASSQEGRFVLKPRCSRWYTFLRLVSLCEVDEVNKEGYTLLHTAAFSGDLAVVKFLVDSGADLASLTVQGNTALTKALDLNRVEVAAFLLEEGSKAVLISSTSATLQTPSPPSPSSPPTPPDRSHNPNHNQHHTHHIQHKSADLSWMLGTRDIFDILSKMVQKRRAQMLRLLFSYGLRPKQEAELAALLREAATVENNHVVVRMLKEVVSGSTRGGPHLHPHHHHHQGDGTFPRIRDATSVSGGGGVRGGGGRGGGVHGDRSQSASAAAVNKGEQKSKGKGLRRILGL